MAFDDYLEPEVMIAVAVTAAVAAPPVRRALRKGLVYGLAGLLTIGDKVAGTARTLAENAQHAAHNLAGSAERSAAEAGQTAGSPHVEVATS
jgi:hypothetical protein